MAKPAVYVSTKTDNDGCVIVVQPINGSFDQAWLEQLLDSVWHDELAKLRGVNGDVALAPREILIGHSLDSPDAFLAIVLPKLKEQFAIVSS